MCWLINKTFLSPIHINTKNQKVKAHLVNPKDIDELAVTECASNIAIFIKISFTSFKDMPIEVLNARKGNYDVNRMLQKK